MRILLIADEPCKAYWDYYDESKLKDIDLILSAGDLPPEYLSFLETFTNVPLLYVRGNHDTKYDRKPPEGCICIDDRIYVYEGIRIMGLGGSMRYNERGFQFTEKEMEKRVKRMRFSLMKNRGIDILLTHAPVRGFGDQEDIPHRGFECFHDLITKYQPSYMVHGHVHQSYTHEFQRQRQVENTTVINAYERYILDYEKRRG